MKNLLLICSILSMLIAVSCNRNEDKGSQGEMQREESVPVEQVDDAQLEEDRSGQRPGFEKDQNMENDIVTEPMDERPDFQEEGPDINEEMER